MASLTRWTWVWMNSGSWWWTGRPGVLRFMGSQRVWHDWATDLIWSEISIKIKLPPHFWRNRAPDLFLLLGDPGLLINLPRNWLSLIYHLSTYLPTKKSQWCTKKHMFIISVLFNRSVVWDSLRPHELQHARPPCPSPTPGVHPDSRPWSQWCHPDISSSAVHFSFCLQSLPEGLLLLLLVSLFSRVRLCATPETAAHQAPPSLGFSRQEHWSGLLFPSPMHESEKWKWSHSVVSDSLQPHGLQPTRLLHPWDFPGKSTEVGCHCLLRLTTREPGNFLW